MIQQSTLSFLQALKKHNDREWLEKNKPKLEAAKTDFQQMVAIIYDGILQQNTNWIKGDVKKTIFRLYRDVRFSKDKSPYKTHFGAAFSATGKKDSGGGFYVHVQPGNHSFIAGGFWNPDPKALQAIRQEIDYNFKAWQSLVQKSDFKKAWGALSEENKLQRVPKGYEPENPAAEYLKLKSFTVSAPISDEELLQKNIAATILKKFAVLKPMVDFLGEAIK